MFGMIGVQLKDFASKKGPFNKVLDVGSRDINGSVREFFSEVPMTPPGEFVGIDFIDGPGVDVVMNAHDLLGHFKPNSFDLVTCCETLEHDDNFWVTVENMRQLVRPGGWLFISTPGINFFKHDYPFDYWRFTEESYTHVFFKDWDQVFVMNHTSSQSEYVNKPNNIIGYARKPL